MWFSFWRSRDRFSLDEFRFLTDQLLKVQVVNEVNKDFVIEALRSISELITYGDQHDVAYFEFFMEKQVMGEFVRILRISRTVIVSLQLLQTMSIVIQNLKNEHSIYYMFSNEHINHLITYSFDFRNEELLSYYISFLRAISGKLNKNTISLLVKTHNEEVVSFPLYVEAIRFAFHEESMIRTAVRALTLNVYHVGDEAVNKFVASDPHADYFSNLVKFFGEQCINLDKLVNASKCLGPDTSGSIHSSVDEIEDNLYYFSDVISAGIPDIGRLITDLMLKDTGIGTATSLYLLCCILRIVKIKDLANIVAAVLLCDIETFVPRSEAKLNGFMVNNGMSHENQDSENGGFRSDSDGQSLRVLVPNISSSLNSHPEDDVPQPDHGSTYSALREALLSYITAGDDVQVSGSLSVLATLLQTKELEESMLDALGILPQRKQQKKLLLQALVGEGSAEEQLFSSENMVKDGIGSETDCYFQKLKEQYGLLCVCKEVTVSPRRQRLQVLDALVSLFCRSNISAETLWDGGWLLRQLLPYSEADFNSHHVKLLKDSFHSCTSCILDETKGTWPDLLIMVLCDEWRKCKRTIEASSPRKDPKLMLLPSHKPLSEELAPGESSFAAGERLFEIVKVFVLLHQLHIFSVGKVLPDQPPIHPTVDVMETARAKRAGVDSLGPKPSVELSLVDAVPCRIAFERGKERHFHFLAISVGTSGWLILADELPVRPSFGVVRVVAPLGGCNPRIDEKHMRWLHLRIRPSSLPYIDAAKHTAHAKVKSKALVDGRWTLAFRDEDSCKAAFSMIVEEQKLLSDEVERRIKPMLDIERTIDTSTK
ncbi:protein TRANSPARENT TESTA 9 isoform X2 [Lycium ferocissimum]|uniref:protein TRANSPARENT TESTA 9 isoform X2 n=1 Tax=Lycium ferocissimum TaxID=112874 RepID=UPI002814DB6E|nr:protein TRANSPARENT TESTA 9 isoform X2 [Lycium ferocissimum]